jgi:hypothetical protein
MTRSITLMTFLFATLVLGGTAVTTMEMADGADSGDALYGAVEDDPPMRRADGTTVIADRHTVVTGR